MVRASPGVAMIHHSLAPHHARHKTLVLTPSDTLLHTGATALSIFARAVSSGFTVRQPFFLHSVARTDPFDGMIDGTTQVNVCVVHA